MTQASPNPAASAKQALSAFENGQFELAIEGFREAREGFIAAGNPLQGAEMANNLAVALVQAGRHEGLNDWERAESLYQQAAERFADLDDPDNQQYTLQALSRIRLRQGRALEAVNTMQGALESKKHTNWSTRLAQKILSLPSRMLKP
jgi:tetratricopeptide (TPR) repeat protein